MKEQFKKYAEEFIDTFDLKKKDRDGSIMALNFFIDFVFESKGKIVMREQAVEFVNFVAKESKGKIIKDELESKKEVVLFLYEFIKFLKEKENES